MKKIMIAIFLLSVGCAQVPQKPSSLMANQPEVLYVLPEDRDLLPENARWMVFFSDDIDLSSITSESLLVVKGEVTWDDYKTTSDFRKALTNHKFDTLELAWDFYPNERVLLIEGREDLSPSQTYSLVFSGSLKSQKHLPLKTNQKGAVVFNYESGPQGFVPHPDPVEEVLQDLSPVTVPTPTVPEETPPTSFPQDFTQPPAPDLEEPSSVEEEVPQIDQPFQSLVINEIFYDATGSDTDGVIFVELAGQPTSDISGVHISFINGDNGAIYDTITLPQGSHVNQTGLYVIADSRTSAPTVSQVARAQLITNFDPQNGPDAVQLLAPNGTLLDAMGYGDGLQSRAENNLPLFEGTSATDVGQGFSLERREKGRDTQNNRDDFVVRQTPTPGL